MSLALPWTNFLKVKHFEKILPKITRGPNGRGEERVSIRLRLAKSLGTFKLSNNIALSELTFSVPNPSREAIKDHVTLMSNVIDSNAAQLKATGNSDDAFILLKQLLRRENLYSSRLTSIDEIDLQDIERRADSILEIITGLETIDSIVKVIVSSSRDNLISCMTDTSAEIIAKYNDSFGKLSQEIVSAMMRSTDENRAAIADVCVLAQQLSMGAIESGINLREEFLLSSVPEFDATRDMVFTNVRQLGKLASYSNVKSMMLRLFWDVITSDDHNISYNYAHAAEAIIKMKGNSRLFELVKNQNGKFSVEEVSLDDIEDECMHGGGVIYRNFASYANS